MNKLRLPALLLLSAMAAFIIQSCNKSAVTAIAYTSASYQANIDGIAWAPTSDSVSTTINYNSAAQTKTFSITGAKNARQVVFAVTVNAGNTPGFPIGTYIIDQVNTTAQYNTQQKNTSGSYVFMPEGTVEPGAGSIIVTAVDSVKKQITGTFSLYSRSTVYDGSGNVVSTTVDNITSGEFNALPYTFTSN